MTDSEEKIRKTIANQKSNLESILDFFYVGRNLNYPVTSYDAGQELTPAVFLGFIIDTKRKNPYAPSSLRLRFAIASSNKYVVIPASYAKDVHAIKGASVSVPELEVEELLGRWEASIKESTVDRKVRHIITGNVLQAFSTFKGKLVSYTTLDGERKGILMPEYWEPNNDIQQKTVVPIARAIKIIRSLTVGASITTKNAISIFRQPDKFKIMVASARSKGGEIYLDPDILQIVDKNNFEKVSDKMVATINETKIDKLVELLQEKFSDSVSLSPAQFDIIKGEVTKRLPRIKPVMVVQLRQVLPDELELEALALEIELELLEFAA